MPDARILINEYQYRYDSEAWRATNRNFSESLRTIALTRVPVSGKYNILDTIYVNGEIVRYSSTCTSVYIS
jgi:hypothetical protein